MHAEIEPVSVFPDVATRLYVRSGSFGPPPSFYYELQSVTPGAVHPAIGTEGELGYLPPVTDPDVVIMLKNGNASMTDLQWSSWTNQPDDSYILSCIALNLNLTLRK